MRDIEKVFVKLMSASNSRCILMWTECSDPSEGLRVPSVTGPLAEACSSRLHSPGLGSLSLRLCRWVTVPALGVCTARPHRAVPGRGQVAPGKRESLNLCNLGCHPLLPKGHQQGSEPEIDQCGQARYCKPPPRLPPGVLPLPVPLP